MKDEEKCCGDCCWFYAEDTYGYGACPFQFAEVKKCDEECPITMKYVSRKEMRHHMAVLLQYQRYAHDTGDNYRWPSYDDRLRAMEFAYEYMKVFGNL